MIMRTGGLHYSQRFCTSLTIMANEIVNNEILKKIHYLNVQKLIYLFCSLTINKTRRKTCKSEPRIKTINK